MKRKDDDGEYRDVQLGRVAAQIEAAGQRARKYCAMDFWRPYPKQREFFAAGKDHREVAQFAGSQLGKTEGAAYQMACHLTGVYPPDWPGRVFTKPIKAWAVGENLKMTRDIMQKKLCGEPGDVEAFGSGMIPKHLFVGDPTPARGESDAYDTIQVRHASGGVSTLRFRTYQAGRQALQGETLDVVWLDEEPPTMDIYSECLARISATNGLLFITFTPLLGMTGVAMRYREEQSPDRTFVQMGIDDVPADGHIPPGLRATIVAGYPDHEREARSRGEPMLGEGRVYQEPEENIVEDFNVAMYPRHWRWCWGIDVGISHPWAAVLTAYDVDNDIIHLVADLRASSLMPDSHAAMMHKVERDVFNREMSIPVAWPADADQRDKGTGVAVKDVYKRVGLRMMADPAHIANVKGSAGFSVEAGVALINERERAGKLRIARNCTNYLEERRLYHRKDGQIVKLKDDTLAAGRYAILMVRSHGKPLDECGFSVRFYPGPGGGSQGGGGQQYAKGSEATGGFDLFTGKPWGE